MGEYVDYFDSIPNDQVALIALELDSTRIAYLCRTNMRFSNIICNNSTFWYLKFVHDFGLPDYRITNWKSAYEDYGTTIILDDRTPLKIRCKYIATHYNIVVMIDLDDNVWAIFDDVIPEREDVPFIPVLIPDIKAKHVATGTNKLMIIDLNDNVFIMGHGTPGQLGNNKPLQLNNLKGKFIACGSDHYIIIDLDNNILGFGANESGQLGLGDNLYRQLPTQIANVKAKFITCGSYHTIITDLDNNTYSFGENTDGQLGLRDNINRYIPTQIPNLKSKSAACGTSHTVILGLDNTVWTFGDIERQPGDNLDRNVPIQIPNLTAKQVACGDRNTMILDMNNNVWVSGVYNFEIILVPTQIPDLKARFIAPASTFSLVIEVTNKHIVSYNEIAKKLLSGEVDNFQILPEYQSILKDKRNVAAIFRGKDDYIYISELQYNNITNEIFPPLQ